MKMKENISIEEFDNKKFKIHFVEEDDNRKAVLTHYLHNYRNGVKKHYEKEAKKYLKEIIEYKNEEENIDMVADLALQQLLFEVENVPFPTPENYTFKFIDLFAGMGGMKLGFQNAFKKHGFDTECVMTSEIKPYAIKTLTENFKGEHFVGDIFKVKNDDQSIIDSVFKINDPIKAIRAMVEEQLRAKIFTFNHDKIFGKRNEIGDEVKDTLASKLHEFGMELDSVQVKDIQLDSVVTEAMNLVV